MGLLGWGFLGGEGFLKRKFQSALLVVGTVLIMVLMWGTVIEPYTLEIAEVTAFVPGLPPAWEGKVIAVTGDLQIGMWLDNESTIRQAVASIIDRDPAAVLLVGDHIYHSLPDPTKEVRRLQNLVLPLQEAEIPVYAVLGDHDYGKHFNNGHTSEALAGMVASSFEDVGIKVLRNEARPLTLSGEIDSEGQALYLVGIGPENPGKSNPEQALAQVPQDAARIVFFHNPDIVTMLPANSAPFAVSGHTHGGQIRIPFTPDWNMLDVAVNGEFHAEGWFYDFGAEGNHLYVNRGIGFSLLPIRINAPPELTFFTLKNP